MYCMLVAAEDCGAMNDDKGPLVAREGFNDVAGGGDESGAAVGAVVDEARAGSIGRPDADDSRCDLGDTTSPSLRAHRGGRFGRPSTGHRLNLTTGTRQFSPGRVDRMAAAMVEAAARSPPRRLSSTAMIAMGACGCSSAMRLSVVTRVVKPPRSATARSSSSRSERQLWKAADSTTTPPSCCWSGWRRRGDTPTSRRTFTPGCQEGETQSGLRAAAAQTAVAPARRTAATALGSI